MWHPLNIRFFADVNNIAEILSCMQLIEYYPVINAVDFCFYPIKHIKNFFAMLYEFGYTYRLNTGEIASAIKIYPGFLFMWFNFEKYYIFGLMVTQEDLPEQIRVRFAVVATKIMGVV